MFTVLPLVPLSSELCTNQSAAQIRNVILFSNYQRGITVYPKQNIHLAPWITFPSTSHVIPFTFVSDESQYSEIPFNVYLLIETDVIPSSMVGKSAVMVGWHLYNYTKVEWNTNKSFYSNCRWNSLESLLLGKWIPDCRSYCSRMKNNLPTLSWIRS